MKQRLFATIFFGGFTALFFLWSSTTHAADSDLEKGFEAALEEDWQEAVEHFGYAFERNPYNPIVQFNYGLAQARIGNELPAIALLNTYLAAVPNAANRPQVEAQIEALLSNAEVKSRRIFEVAIESVRALPPGQIGRISTSARRWDLLWLIAGSQAESGYLAEARETLELATIILSQTTYRTEELDEGQFGAWSRILARSLADFPGQSLLNDIAIAQANAQDFEAAERTLAELVATDHEARDLLSTLITQRIFRRMDAGDLAGAVRILDSPESLYGAMSETQDEQLDSTWLAERLKYPAAQLIDAYLQSGDLQAAASVARDHNASSLGSVAIAWLRRGNSSAARQLAADAESLADSDCGIAQSAALQGHVARAIDAGNRIEAHILAPNSAVRCLRATARAFAYLGDEAATSTFYDMVYQREVAYEGERYISPYARAYPLLAQRRFNRARRMIDRIETPSNPDEFYRDQLRLDLIYIAAQSGDTERAEEYARDYERLETLPVIADAYQARGDVREADRLHEEIRQREADRHEGWTAADAEQAEAVEIWLKLSEGLLTAPLYEGFDESVRDMGSFLDDTRNEEPTRIVNLLRQAGKTWGWETIRMRALRSSIGG